MKMKKILSLLIVLVMCLGLFAACNGSGEPVAETVEPPITETVEPTETASSEPDFTAFTTFTTEGVLDFPLEFTLLPGAYNTYDTAHKGTDMVIHYTTDVYEDGVTYEKFARIYLPYGYDPDDKDTKYNVIYFQHGNMGSPNEFFDHATKSANAMNLFDNMFDPDHQLMKPCIIVCPTYYLEYDESAYITPADAKAGDGRTEGIPGNYYKEVLEDLIPAVESQLNVHCEDFTPEGIKATRDHRAWAGHSRGSVCTWYMFHNNFEYFRWYMPQSADARPENVPPDTYWSEEEAFQYIKDPIDANPELPYFIFAVSGGKNDAPNMRTQMKSFLTHTDTFSFGLDVTKNNIYYTCSEFDHLGLFFPYYLYNARDVLFNIPQEVVVCLGDSITAGDYPALLEEKLGEDFRVVNFGSPGRTMVNSAQLAYSKTGFLEKAVALNPDVVIVMLGTNDTMPKNWNEQEYEKDYLDLVRELQTWERNPAIYLMIPPPAFVAEGKDKVAFDIDANLLQNVIPGIVRRIAEETGVPVIDIFSAMQNHPEYTDDGVHPNIEGSTVIANTVFEALKSK